MRLVRDQRQDLMLQSNIIIVQKAKAIYRADWLNIAAKTR
jgi:hypothetical protein